MAHRDISCAGGTYWHGVSSDAVAVADGHFEAAAARLSIALIVRAIDGLGQDGSWSQILECSPCRAFRSIVSSKPTPLATANRFAPPHGGSHVVNVSLYQSFRMWQRLRSAPLPPTAYLTVHSASRQSLAAYVSAICAKPFGSASSAEAPYLAENVSAMTKMMIEMGIRPSGDVDTDFVAMMVPHHQGAIEMAQAELRYGRNEPLRRMAQEIIVTQLQEITAMRSSLINPCHPPYHRRTKSRQRGRTI